MVIVAIVGSILARQLSSVPENALKMVVGLMLVSFGTFWAGEGVGVHWPGSDLAIPVLVAFYAAVAWVAVRRFGGGRVAPATAASRPRGPTMTDPEPGAASRPVVYRIVAGFGRFWWDFLVGDTPELFVGAVVVVGLVALMCIDHSLRTVAAVIMPVLVCGRGGAFGVEGESPASVVTPRARSVPEVVELQRDPEVLRFQRGDRRLEVVPLLPADPQLVALGLRAHPLEPEILDELVDLLGVVRGDPGLDGQLLAGGAPGTPLRSSPRRMT